MISGERVKIETTVNRVTPEGGTITPDSGTIPPEDVRITPGSGTISPGGGWISARVEIVELLKAELRNAEMMNATKTPNL
jgi:hypothetical protein